MLIPRLLKLLYKFVAPHWVKNALQLTLSDVERYHQIPVLELPPGTRILVLAPHPDDESVGCGGSISKCLAAGHDVHVIVLTDGRCGSAQIRQLSGNNPESGKLQKALIETRRTELQSAMELIGVTQIQFLDAMDSQLTLEIESISKTLAHEIDKWKPDTVILPFITDRHADHFAASRCLIEACKLLDSNYTGNLICMGYETWSPIYANVLIDISSTMDKKLEAINCYQSQLADVDYKAAIEGLNRYRAITGMYGGTHAEAYYMCPFPVYERLYHQLLL